jgi:hypothetical protein
MSTQDSAGHYHLLSAAHDITRGRAIAGIDNLQLQAAFVARQFGTFAHGVF